MFTPKGLFSGVACPYQETCVLPKCIFGHLDVKVNAGSNTNREEQSAVHDQEGQRKRQKVIDDSLRAEDTECKTGLGSTYTTKAIDKPLKVTSMPDGKAPKGRSATTRDISPPPLKRKAANATAVTPKDCPAQNGHNSSAASTRTAKSTVQTPVKAPLKIEALNPRALKIPAPASHDMRFRLLRALHEQLTRLNSELGKDASDVEEELVLSEQALITMCLDIEEDAAASSVIYSNLVKNKILFYKRMTVKQWVEERAKEVAKANALEAASISDTPATKPSEPPKPIETGLSIHEELTLLHRLYTPITGLSKHGYVTEVPTEQEIDAAKQGIEMAKGWEVCDRCKNRFQVFPSRREEDGALSSGGKCTYHFGKPYFPERSPTDPKAKREKRFRCCGESMGDSAGCTQADSHVFKISEVKRLAAILNFEKTPENLERLSHRPVCIDGEMGYTVYGLELIRLTATSWPDGESLFDVLVRPIGPILDLNSRYSGVWPKHMAEALPWSASVPKETDDTNRRLRIVDSPAAARAILFSYLSPATPLIGHGLENDLNATRILHPTIIDTALLFPHKAGLPYRNGLKMLMHTHLNKHIQVVVDGKMDGHDSKEDANAAGDLVRFALANEWQKMQRHGWVVKDGEFRPPLQKEPLPPGAPKVLPDSPIKILSSTGLGEKRSREEMEKDAEEENLRNDSDHNKTVQIFKRLW
jgi:RNA exonuclease 1